MTGAAIMRELAQFAFVQVRPQSAAIGAKPGEPAIAFEHGLGPCRAMERLILIALRPSRGEKFLAGPRREAVPFPHPNSSPRSTAYRIYPIS